MLQFKDNLFIVHHSWLLASYFKQVFHVTILQKKKLALLTDFIGLRILVACCRSFTKIRKRWGPGIDPCASPHLINSFYGSIFFIIASKLFLIVQITFEPVLVFIVRPCGLSFSWFTAWNPKMLLIGFPFRIHIA